MLSYVRPVGESISIRQGAPIADYATYDMQLYASGTMALQQALSLAKERAHSTQPEVLLPAYACPDLISACVGAGVNAVLLDLDSPASPFPTIDVIKQHTNEHTIAVILVNFLGISPEKKLFDAIKELRLLAIEDRAQCFIAPEEASQLNGDYVIFSFGKGKPVSLLGGGALLVKDHKDSRHSADLRTPEERNSKLPWLIRLYNLIILPAFYYLLMKIPALSIGETHYHAPEAVTLMDSSRRALLQSNIEKQYRSLSRFAQKRLYAMCTPLSDIQALGNSELNPSLLRFPLLCKDRESRDLILSKLNRQGIGASKMYQTILPNIKGTPLSDSQQLKDYPNAQKFADRLLTLPCHSGVNTASLRKIANIFRA